jgi:16S rRNA (guanine966-N2)-methyltransferase
VGIEALSRGAMRAVFIESHRPAANLIRANLESLGVRVAGARPIRPPRPPKGARVVAMDEASGKPIARGAPPAEILVLDAAKALRLLEVRHVLADFVYVDPPYEAREQYNRALEILSSGKLLAPAGSIIVESLHELPMRIGALECTRMVKQGDTLLTFYHLARAA